MDSHWKSFFIIFSLSLILLLSTTAIECRRLNLNPELLRKQNDGNQEPVTIRLDKSPEQLGEKSPSLNFLFHRIRRALGGQSGDGVGSPSSYAYHFNDSHYVAQVHWSGVNSSSIMVLMKDPDYGATSDRPSYFYVSNDYGKSFENLTSKFVVENGTIATLTNFFGSRSSNMVYALVAKYQRYIFMSLDECKSFTPVKVDFYVNEVKFHQKQYSYILAHEGEAASSRRLYVSTDVGMTWKYMASGVVSYFWDFSPEEYTFYFYYHQALQASGEGFVYKANSNYRERSFLWWRWTERLSAPVMTGVAEFQLVDNYMFAARHTSNGSVTLFVSYKRGAFAEALFPRNTTASSFVIADASENETMVAVNYLGQTNADLYISDQSGQKFSRSLERILYYNRKEESNKYDFDHDFVDLHQVAGVSGVYIATQLSVGTSGLRQLKSLITFDKGGLWAYIPAPAIVDGKPSNCSVYAGCSLHLSQEYALHNSYTRHQPVLSKASAPGFILATGSVGDNLKTSADVFFSSDAGLTWRQVLDGRYYYAFADHGGVIVAVDQYGLVDTLTYSYDEGLTWHYYKFMPDEDDKIRVYGLLTEPGEKTTIFTLFGSHAGRHSWVIVQVDMRNIFGRKCNDEDYYFWRISDGRNDTERCLLGVKQEYERRFQRALCYNGLDYERENVKSVCECAREDFGCDFGFSEQWQGWFERSCVPDNSSFTDPTKPVGSCPYGNTYNVSKGYRKVPGDQCVGGVEDTYKYEMRLCPIPYVQDFLVYAQRTSFVRRDLNTGAQITFTIPGSSNVIAVDVDYRSMLLFWADITSDNIMAMNMSNGRIWEILSFNDSVANVESLAFDWTSKMLYWCDAGSVNIGVVDSTGGSRKIIVKDDLDRPRALALHPRKGYMFWTDWGDKARIERAEMDGSNRMYIISTNIKSPNGLAVDYQQDRLYWVDAGYDVMESCSLDGAQRKIVKQYLSHPYAVAILNEYVYWTDWSRRALLRARKENGEDEQFVRAYVYSAMDVKAFSAGKQADVSGCSPKPCSFICLAKANMQYTCACPDNFIERRQGSNVTCTCPPGEELVGKKCRAIVGSSCSANQFTCTNRNCIPSSWRCDHDNDCVDGSDEENCGSHTCPPMKFLCANGRCVSPSWLCDGDNDCGDGSDESNCTSTCSGGRFRCNNGRCIMLRWLCDGENDCSDWGDEQNCKNASSTVSTTVMTVPTCGARQFTCLNTGRCIPISWRCNGIDDCGDNSDEGGNCSVVRCATDAEFKCVGSARCVPSSYRCDGDSDCDDDDGSGQSSDEQCCGLNEDICRSGECINKLQRCDRVSDCRDGSDEIGCPTVPQTVKPKIICKGGQFTCSDESACVQISKLCNGYPDCRDMSDEKSCATRPPITTSPPCCKKCFQCLFKYQCISMGRLCDGKMDCEDGSDELNCAVTTFAPVTDFHCATDQFTCQSQTQCIPLASRCDGVKNCMDGTDEANCGTIPPLEECKPWPFGFRCENSECLQWSDALCDGRTDCPDQSDENRRICNGTDRVQNLRYSYSNGAVQLTWDEPQNILLRDFAGISVHYREANSVGAKAFDLPKLTKSHLLDGLLPCKPYEVAVGVKTTSADNRTWLYVTTVVKIRENDTPTPPTNFDILSSTPFLTWTEDSGLCYPAVANRELRCDDVPFFEIPNSDVLMSDDTKSRQYELPNVNFRWGSTHNCTLAIVYENLLTPYESRPFSFTVGGKSSSKSAQTRHRSSVQSKLVWVVPVSVVLLAFMIGIIVMVYKYRRLQRSFLAFAARGSYSRQHDIEDDDELDMAVEFRPGEDHPMINRFSDDEPLVVG